ncbi:MAG: hypothetical protein KAJ54_02270 [Candidatus Aenigmarchaeota archaeon]|nr:hypothetical protein [Candidatus Aenigmarchaeota archaeon]MCK5321678.1 hypothetical protein [Candidatus Aenigmarchaeota archaeon]
METKQIETMFRIARETNNLSDLRRLQKIRDFHNPDFNYLNRKRGRSIIGYPVKKK